MRAVPILSFIVHELRYRRLLVAFVGAASVLAASSCGGGGSSPSLVSSQGTNGGGSSSQPNAKTANVAFTVLWPSKSAQQASRHRDYVSPSTLSVSVAINGGTPTVIANPNLASGSSSFTKQTTVSIAAPTGSDSFGVSSYDTTTGTGNLLGSATVFQTVAIDEANTVSVTLNGNLGKIAVAQLATSPFVSGTFPTYTFTGQSPQTFVITPEDLDGNVIVAPGNVPALTLTSATPADVLVTSTSTVNQYTVQSQAPNSSIVVTASGKNLAGTAVTTMFTVNTLAALYVVNNGVGETSPSVSIYPVASPAAAATPIVTISGANTEMNAIQFPAVDTNGTLYVSNQGPMPGLGVPFGPTSGYITVFNGAAQAGTNQTPTAVISGLNRPEGLAFDASNDLYVMLERSLVEYPPSPTAMSSPIAAIGPPNPTVPNPAPSNNADLDGCYGDTVDSNGLIYAACSDAIVYFAKGATGNIAPVGLIEPEGSTSMTFASDSWLSVATDSTDKIYTPDANNNLNMVMEYAAGANDGANTSATPGFTAVGTGFSIPWGIAIDSLGQVYVSNYTASTVEIFSSATVLRTGLPTATISTGVNVPFGIAVR